jgi:hypothetical protein
MSDIYDEPLLLMPDDEDDFGDELSPPVLDEQSTGNSNSQLESGDNVLDMAHEVGFYEDADEEHPMELNIAEQINQAERKQWEN